MTREMFRSADEVALIVSISGDITTHPRGCKAPPIEHLLAKNSD